MHNAGYIITQVFLIAEELNMHFSLVFTIEDTSSLPVTETKFNGTEGGRLEQGSYNLLIESPLILL